MEQSKVEPEKMELVIVTHVVDAITFWAQNVTEDQAVEMMGNLLAEKCPTAQRVLGRPSPQKIYGALFSEDNNWYRCKVQQQTDDDFHVSYIDYGNMEVVNRSALVELPEDLQSASLAKKYKFWSFHVSSEQDSPHFLQGKSFLQNLVFGKKVRIHKKSVCFDGTILVQAFQGNLDIGEEVLKMKFAKISLPGNRESPVSPRILQEPSGLWPLQVLDRGSQGDPEKTYLPVCMPKLRPAFTDQKPQVFKEKSTTTPLQPANLLKKTADKDLAEENGWLRAERDAQQQSSLAVEQKLSNTLSELQKVKEEVEGKTREMEKLKEEKSSLQQRADHLEKQLQDVRSELQTLKQEFQKKLEDVDKSLETRVENKMSKLAEKVDSVRKLRESNPFSAVGDSLLESINTVVKNSISVFAGVEKLEVAWQWYGQAQEKLRVCRAKEELRDLMISRNQLRSVLAAALDAFLQEVDGLPVSERMETLEEVGASLTAVFGSFSMEHVEDQAFEQFSKWKSQKQHDSSSVRQTTDKALHALCTWAANMGKFFCLSEKTLVTPRDIAAGVDTLLNQAMLDVGKELVITLSEQDSQEIKIVSNAFYKVMQHIQREQSLLCGIREKYVLNTKFKQEMLQWQDNTPKADKLFSIKKRIKTLRSQLRWRQVEEGCLEDADELDLPEILKKKEEIAETRNALFQEISREKEEYRKLGDLVNGGFPELPLLYPEADILSYMSSDGLLMKSLDRDMFDAEPMRELSGRRPLVCTEFQCRKIVLKGYAVDEETEARMLVCATQYHRAQSRSPEASRMLPLMGLFFGKSDPLAYVMVPYFSNGSLKAVQKACPLTCSEVVKVMRGVALGLQALHAVGITHGSLQPSNVFVLNREHGIVGDYDLTKTPEQRAADSGMVAGSISLVAPELRQGQSPTPASDMYAFGCLMLWLHLPEYNRAVDNKRLTPDISGLQLDPKLQALLSKLLTCTGRLTAPEALADDYFLTVEA